MNRAYLKSDDACQNCIAFCSEGHISVPCDMGSCNVEPELSHYDDSDIDIMLLIAHQRKEELFPLISEITNEKNVNSLKEILNDNIFFANDFSKCSFDVCDAFLRLMVQSGIAS